MGRLPAWLATAPILVVGLFAGHQAGYLVALPSAHARAEALEASGHSYLTHTRYAAAVLAVLAVLALALRVRAALTGRTRTAPPWAFALLSPAAFVLLEVSERLSHGELSAELLLTPQVLVGLGLQLPFAVAGLFVARALLEVADAVGGALRRTRRPVPRFSFIIVPVGAVLLRPKVPALAYGERGPPFHRR